MSPGLGISKCSRRYWMSSVDSENSWSATLMTRTLASSSYLRTTGSPCLLRVTFLPAGDVDPRVRAQRVAGALLKAALGVRAGAEDRVEVGEVSEAHLRADLVQRDHLPLGGRGDTCDRLAHRRGDAQVALLLQLAEQPPVQCVEREVPDRLVVQRLDQLQPPGLGERLAHERTRPDRRVDRGRAVQRRRWAAGWPPRGVGGQARARRAATVRPGQRAGRTTCRGSSGPPGATRS